jgi:hypothetical protein
MLKATEHPSTADGDLFRRPQSKDAALIGGNPPRILTCRYSVIPVIMGVLLTHCFIQEHTP